MKKVLIVGFNFKNDAIGSIRLRGLAKYLPRFGWEPTILTVKRSGDFDSNLRIIETEYQDLFEKWKRNLHLKPKESIKNQFNVSDGKSDNYSIKTHLINSFIKIWVELFAYPDSKKNWYGSALDASDDLFNNNAFDAIISSSRPVTSHLIANELKKKFKIPWIADLRDLWTQNHTYSFSRYRKFFDTKLEKKVLGNANEITTVSQPLKNKLCINHPLANVHVITNGFDPDEVYSSEIPRKFNITFTGTIYKENNDIKPLFKALSELINENVIKIQHISLDFYGNNMEDWIFKYGNLYGLQRIINFYGLIPRREALNKQKSSQLLLLLDWTNCNEKGITTGKIYEYMAAQRPIIAIGPCKDVVSDLLRETGAGVHLSTVDEIKHQISIYYKEYLKKGRVEYGGIPSEIEKYSQIGMAQKFAHILDDIT